MLGREIGGPPNSTIEWGEKKKRSLKRKRDPKMRLE